MKRQHKHADMMRRWLDDASLEVEWKEGDADRTWIRIPPDAITWDEECEYRFKPKMIKCGDLEFPEPMRVAPEVDELVWLTTLVRPELVQWSDNQIKDYWLKLGLIHATKESAEAHARALVALTEVKE